MIGERIESRGDLPWVWLFFLAVGLGLVTAGLIFGTHWLLTGAALPLALGGSLCLFGRERSLTATFREHGLEVEDAGPPVLVPYASIQNITAGGRLADPAEFRKASCPIEVAHDGGLLQIPSRLNFPSHEVYRFLAKRVPDRGGRDVNPVLAEYLEDQERRFGQDGVRTYRAASRRLRGGRRGYRAFLFGLMGTGAAWTAAGFSGFDETAWGAAGIICAFLGAILYAASFGEGIREIKNWKKASLVIGPEGMAMVQGDIQGEVLWPELLQIRFNARPRGFTLGNQRAMLPGILLKVKGANIVIADIYDRPLYVIYHRILAASGRSKPRDGESA
ncbi:MAG: hypothetical protein ACLQIB_54365 [Isosphaeraceae bacterium]